MCQHQAPDATSLIACLQAFKNGYECTEENLSITPLPLAGTCRQCILRQQMLRQSMSHELQRQRRWSAVCQEFQYNEEDNCSIDDSDAEELDVQTRIAQSTSSASRAENRKTSASFHRGPSRMPTIVQPSSPHLSHVAVVEDAHNHAGDEEDSNAKPLQDPLPQMNRSWHSRIPLPTRVVRTQQNRTYQALITDDNMSDTEPLLRSRKPKYHRTWRSRIPLHVGKLSKK
ncbi:uncharacterized protein PGRI_087950 [Penicillium griseofulvum]|uniref:Uncharacterized protein n=1 Tax=Penicillium patulum TaxID=5078 RepID=A0A135LUC7_PENPA|nr:uncharacterized protein PGRI_087950 [Penicillium griseofulvum]KXG52511.1 hypothetical protein PGRI_087950 [Penicillium griseofulvum]